MHCGPVGTAYTSLLAYFSARGLPSVSHAGGECLLLLRVLPRFCRCSSSLADAVGVCNDLVDIGF